MTTIFDKIDYEGKSYSDLNDNTAKLAIENLAAKLKPLENEIVQDPKGSITITPSGNTFAFSFEEELSGRITELITR